MKCFYIAIILFAWTLDGWAETIHSYELPVFVPTERLFSTPSGDLIVSYTTHSNGVPATYFWDTDKHKDLPDIDSIRIAHDMAAYQKAIADHELTPLAVTARGRITLKNGNMLSGEWLNTMPHCQWPYHNYLSLKTDAGAEKTLSFLIRRPPHPHGLTYQCPGVNGTSLLTLSFEDGFPLIYQGPRGGFYIVIIGLPYVIGFTDEGVTDFAWDKSPLVLISEAKITAAYQAMASGKLTPQEAVDSLLPAEHKPH